MNENILELQNISKSFGETKALNNVDFYLRKGTIHGLLGENGAGKTSLMNIISGLYQPDRGTINIHSRKINKLTPEIAYSLGIGMVHQEFRLIDSFTIEDNLKLSKANIFNKNFDDAYKKYSDIFSLNTDKKRIIADLSVGEKQKIEIMKLIFNNSDIMLLDEPTAVLTPQETEQLKIALQKLAIEDEKTIVIITHKLKEIKEFTEALFVMKNGEMVSKFIDSKSTSTKELVEMMMGEATTYTVKKDNIRSEIKLKVENVSLKEPMTNIKILEDINFEIQGGEILGIAGVSGNGQVELANLISGINKIYEGNVLINNEDVTGEGVKSRKKLNFAYIPENRLGVGLAPGVSVIDNSVVREYFKTKTALHLSKSKTNKYLNNLVDKFSIKSANPKAEISTLSGGNMQKLLMGRELTINPEVILASQPTRGLDVNSVDKIHQLLVEQRNNGTAILLISEDLDELFKLSNRLLVIFEGKIIQSFETGEMDISKVGLAMAGINE